MPMDKCGRNLHPGQQVDLLMNGMVTANVVRVDEPRIQVPGQPMVGQILLQFVVGVPFQGSRCPDLYIVGTPKANAARLVAPDGRNLTPVPDMSQSDETSPSPASETEPA